MQPGCGGELSADGFQLGSRLSCLELKSLGAGAEGLQLGAGLVVGAGELLEGFGLS